MDTEPAWLAGVVRDVADTHLTPDVVKVLSATADILDHLSTATAHFAAAKLTSSADDGVALLNQAHDILVSDQLADALADFDAASAAFYTARNTLTVGSPVTVQGVVTKLRSDMEVVVEFEGRVDDPLTDETARVVVATDLVEPFSEAEVGADSFMSEFAGYAGPKFYEGVLPWNED